jgi:hypothetical protein
LLPRKKKAAYDLWKRKHSWCPGWDVIGVVDWFPVFYRKNDIIVLFETDLLTFSMKLPSTFLPITDIRISVLMTKCGVENVFGFGQRMLLFFVDDMKIGKARGCFS